MSDVARALTPHADLRIHHPAILDAKADAAVCLFAHCSLFTTKLTTLFTLLYFDYSAARLAITPPLAPAYFTSLHYDTSNSTPRLLFLQA